ncbi:SCO3374 family protein [Streptomyces sp. NPDC053048]|uniref:SCO3374 family protein n=1 Tax=Streptomyces sp. NPDC053048 TaxID=3365694 RepID=UPI0037D30534
MTVVLPRPCRPLDDPDRPRPWREWRQWYECVLGWPTGPTPAERPLELLTGVRFDALGVPAGAGFAVLGRVPATGPVALDTRTRTMWFLTAAGSAEELPGLLRWLEWGGIDLELTVLGRGGRLVAPAPSVAPAGALRASRGPEEAVEAVEAVWVRPPDPGGEVEPTLPVTGLGGGGRAPDLVRLVSAAATECHRARLLRAGEARRDQPPGDHPVIRRWPSRTPRGSRPGRGRGR